MDFVQAFHNAHPEDGKIALFWLGQAGFLIKTATGRTICIDPYFSDNVLHMQKNIGFKRMSPPPCEADDIAFDVLLISHEHGDPQHIIDSIGEKAPGCELKLLCQGEYFFV